MLHFKAISICLVICLALVKKSEHSESDRNCNAQNEFSRLFDNETIATLVKLHKSEQLHEFKKLLVSVSDTVVQAVAQSDISAMQKRIESVKQADRSADCAHVAISRILAVDVEHLSHASGLAPFSRGASTRDIHHIFSAATIRRTSEFEFEAEESAVAELKRWCSDRAVVCLENENTNKRHVVPVFLSHNQKGLIVVDSDEGGGNQSTSMTSYRSQNGYGNSSILVIAKNLNFRTLSRLQLHMNRNRVVKSAQFVRFVGQDGLKKYTGDPQIQKLLKDLKNNYAKTVIEPISKIDSRAFVIKSNGELTGEGPLIVLALKNMANGQLKETKDLEVNGKKSGYRLDNMVDYKNTWEVQKNGITSLSTVGVVRLPGVTKGQPFMKVKNSLSKPTQQKIEAIIANKLASSVEQQSKILLGMDAFGNLFDELLFGK